jgi:hypothetical protein
MFKLLPNYILPLSFSNSSRIKKIFMLGTIPLCPVFLIYEIKIAVLYWVTWLNADAEVLSQPQFLLDLPPEATQIHVIVSVLLTFRALQVHFEVFEKLMLVFGEISAIQVHSRCPAQFGGIHLYDIEEDFLRVLLCVLSSFPHRMLYPILYFLVGFVMLVTLRRPWLLQPVFHDPPGTALIRPLGHVRGALVLLARTPIHLGR